MKFLPAAAAGLLISTLAYAQDTEKKPHMDKLLDKLTFTQGTASLPYRLLKPDGYATWDLIARKPGLFATAIPVCGGGDPAQAEKLAKLPIWAFHGDVDPLVPVQRSRDMIAAIKQSGGEPKYTEYKGVGHNSWTPTFKNAEVLEWLFKQKKETASR